MAHAASLTAPVLLDLVPGRPLATPVVDDAPRRVTVNERPVELTATEYALLRALRAQREAPWSRRGREPPPFSGTTLAITSPSGRQRHEGGGAGHVFAVPGLPLQEIGLQKTYARDANQKPSEQQRADDRPEFPGTGTREAPQAPPQDRFAEVVRMPGVAPQAPVADPPPGSGLRLEPGHLPVADRFETEADYEQDGADRVEQPRARPARRPASRPEAAARSPRPASPAARRRRTGWTTGNGDDGRASRGSACPLPLPIPARPDRPTGVSPRAPTAVSTATRRGVNWSAPLA